SVNGIADTTGPKISSRTTFMFSLVSTSTVGSTKYPLSPCRPPPATALAPSERPDSRKPQTRLSCSSETRGPISLDSSHPGPTLIFFAFDHFVEDALLHIQAGAGAAALSMVKEDGAGRA